MHPPFPPLGFDFSLTGRVLDYSNPIDCYTVSYNLPPLKLG